jgi:hypothetical protein
MSQNDYSQPKQQLYQSYKPTPQPGPLVRSQYTYNHQQGEQRQFNCKCGVSTKHPTQHQCNYKYKTTN